MSGVNFHQVPPATKPPDSTRTRYPIKQTRHSDRAESHVISMSRENMPTDPNGTQQNTLNTQNKKPLHQQQTNQQNFKQQAHSENSHYRQPHQQQPSSNYQAPQPPQSQHLQYPAYTHQTLHQTQSQQPYPTYNYQIPQQTVPQRLQQFPAFTYQNIQGAKLQQPQQQQPQFHAVFPYQNSQQQQQSQQPSRVQIQSTDPITTMPSNMSRPIMNNIPTQLYYPFDQIPNHQYMPQYPNRVMA